MDVTWSSTSLSIPIQFFLDSVREASNGNATVACLHVKYLRATNRTEVKNIMAVTVNSGSITQQGAKNEWRSHIPSQSDLFNQFTPLGIIAFVTQGFLYLLSPFFTILFAPCRASSSFPCTTLVAHLH